MPGFQQKYTEEQRHAIVAAVVDGNQRVGAAVKAAAEGRLAGLPAFDFNEHSARYYVSEERRKRRGQSLKIVSRTRLDAAVAELATRSIGVLEHELTKLERDTRRKPADIGRIADIVRVLRELRNLARASEPKATAKPAETPNETKRLAAELAKAA